MPLPVVGFGTSDEHRWCSASWFEECADRAFVRTVQTIKIDGINVSDDFDPVLDELRLL